VDELLSVDDCIFVLDITANRMDLLSHLGVAREIGAIEGKKVRFPDASCEEISKPFEDAAGIEGRDVKGCPRYMARVIEGISVGTSPRWLVERLASIGQRSINNIVDVTNYLLFELGTPLHAFDLDRLDGQRIIVRRAGDGEVLRTLDGEERELASTMTVIADNSRTVAVAGIMGGEDSEVTENTVNLLIECAHFNPQMIRRTSRALGLQSESSIRFERWVDPSILPYAVDRAAGLMKMVAGGDILHGRGDVYPDPMKPERVHLRVDRVGTILGKAVTEKEVKTLLESVDFEVNGSRECDVIVPTFRARDITREIDLIEEVARLKGYDWIDSDYRCGVRVFGKIDRQGNTEQEVREFFVREGFFEVSSTSFVGSKMSSSLLGVPEDELIRVNNPVNVEEGYMRPLLLSTILPVLSNNIRKRNPDVRFFELGTIFRTPGKIGDGHHRERLHIACAAAGRTEPLYWKQNTGEWDFFTMKGVVERFIGRFFPGSLLDGPGPDFLDELSSSAIVRDGTPLGFFGELLPEVVQSLEAMEKIFVLEVDAGGMSSPREGGSMGHISRFPPLERDLSLIVPEEIAYHRVEEIIRSKSGDLLNELILFDLYRGGQIPEGKKGLSFRLVFRSGERTLEDPEINTLIDSTLVCLRKEINVVLR